ncbi:MAG: hypothetical protein QNJ45_07455 [Ardenticatenaceae bacterium]|nr:hypothetical protein [Ardenticatenaceae bacterium]
MHQDNQPYQRLLEAVILMAEQYAAEGRWLDAFRLISVGLELANEDFDEVSGNLLARSLT